MANISIQPVTIWNNGENKIAVVLNVNSIQDDLQSQANFYYKLETLDKKIVAIGNISIDGVDYTTWLNNDFSTSWIMSYIATRLNLTIKL